MPFYQRLGEVPHKRHTVFRRPDGELYQEELVGTEGFSSLSSLVYHVHPPTQVKEVEGAWSVQPEVAVENNMLSRSFKGFDIQPRDQYLESRVPVLVNDDLHILLAAPKRSMEDEFFKNADADEMIFIHRGTGRLKSMYGVIEFQEGDHVIVPRGTVYQIEFDKEENRLMILESFSPIHTPNRYRNGFGQMLEHSPFCERDIRPPKDLETHDETGDFRILIKKRGAVFPYIYQNHPFDLIGWDGYHYPFAFSIHDFEPITGRVHLPPPIHQSFEGNNFVVCAFVPRLYDYHPEAIPAPYNHSNIDSDEVLYYVDGDFMSRNDVEPGKISLHPGGVPHGPHPGAMERSIGKEATEEMAVMIDPFNPLRITKQAMDIEVPDYYKSWIQ